MKIKVCVLIALSAMLVLSAKSCEENPEVNIAEVLGADGEEINTGADIPVIGGSGNKINTKDDLIEAMPELKAYSGKFDIKRFRNLIILTTYDHLSFLEAVNKLRNETAMNIPVSISLFFRGAYIRSEGEFEWECSADEAVLFSGEELRPYIGIIHIRDGYWRAIEFNASAILQNAEANNNDKILTNEYCYANAAVYRINNFSLEHGLLSMLDNGPRGGGSVKGDGSTSDIVVSEFDK
jgi:hypothetical protein